MQPELLHQFWHGQSAKNMNTFFFFCIPHYLIWIFSSPQRHKPQKNKEIVQWLYTLHWSDRDFFLFFFCFCILCAVKFPFNQFALSVIRFVQVTGALFRAADVYIWLLLEFLMLSPRMIFIASATYFGGDFLSCFFISASGRSTNKNVVKKKSSDAGKFASHVNKCFKISAASLFSRTCRTFLY